MKDMSKNAQRILEVALEGEKSRGDNGAVLVDNEHVVYLLSHEFQPSDFRQQLEELLSEDDRVHIFIVHKNDDAMHISKIPRGFQL